MLTQRKPVTATAPAPDPGDSSAGTEAPPPARLSTLRGAWRRLSLRWDVVLIVLTSLICLIGLRYFSMSNTATSQPRLFDEGTLALYNGRKNSPLYLALLGEVFDVTKGRRHYDGGKGYGGFVGRDASKAFVTGDFTNDLTDDVKDLSPEAYKSLVEWRAFYHKEYTYKGRLVGRLYDGKGQPTRLLRAVQEGATKAKSEEEAQRELEAKLPACNVRWTEAEGGTVWCDGGAHPRKVFLQLPGGKPTTRCACFAEIGWSDLRQIYPDCSPEAHTCKVS
ncbi:Neuferricin [Tetrabaena socialis]|uniref:Neuferricin n=1 Tax=Tetrabaena socialis TaxID=47790 RepID=A0A2J7ZZ85_9CHLO|nr:Neuferricin [Tetrabaena socialis]|eukprot:PNH05572.1 Neuferricin [Tetrabaena socialis]